MQKQQRFQSDTLNITKSHSHIQERAKSDEHMLEYHDKYHIQNEELLQFSIPLSFFGKIKINKSIGRPGYD